MNRKSCLVFMITKALVFVALSSCFILAGCSQTTNNQYVYNANSHETNATVKKQQRTLSGKYRYDENQDYYFEFNTNGKFNYHGNGVIYQGDYRWDDNEEAYYIEFDREDNSGKTEHVVMIATTQNSGNTLLIQYQGYSDRTFRYSK